MHYAESERGDSATSRHPELAQLRVAIDWIDQKIRRRRWVIVAVWAAALLAATPFAQRQTEHLTAGGFVASGSPSAAVDTDAREFPAASQIRGAIVLRLASGASRASVRETTGRFRRLAESVSHVSVPRQSPPVSSRQRGIQLVPISVSGDWDARIDATKELRERLAGPIGGVKGHLVGQDALWIAVQDVQKEELRSAERVGFPITLIVLLLIFGALSAAVLPLALGAVSVTLTGAAIYLLSLSTDMTLFVTNCASMVGIGVAIDYSLFVLARYRQAIADGQGRDAARRTALRTAGVAVVFSGVTLIVSILGIVLTGSPALRSMATGMVIVVAFSILGAVTLLPALIALIGDRAHARGRLGGLIARRPRLLARRREVPGDFWTRWTGRIMERPMQWALTSAVVMVVLALPALDMRIDNTALDQLPRDGEARRATETAMRAVGPAAFAPVREVITFRRGDGRSPRNRKALGRHVAGLREHPQVARVMPPVAGRDRRKVLLNVIPRSAVESPETRRLIGDLRAEGGAGGAGLGSRAEVAVGGDPALMLDFNNLVSSSMWKIALFLIVVGYLLLMVILRSVLLPLKAVAMTLLSVASAYGLLVVVFQWGWFDGLLGYDSPGHVNTFVLPLLLAVTFGLSMDYEFFMLARIREYVRAGMDDRLAVANGLRACAGTITGAALIMVSVFSVFVAVGAEAIKHTGFGAAVAIALDATLVRLVLVPATMALLGRWNWWFPPVLDRRVPRLAFGREAAPPDDAGGASAGIELEQAPAVGRAR